jgi:hypothetical protein
LGIFFFLRIQTEKVQYIFLYKEQFAALTQQNNHTPRYQTLRYLTSNSVVSEAKQCGILIETLWCFTQNTTLFLKNTTLFFEGYLDACEKVL